MKANHEYLAERLKQGAGSLLTLANKMEAEVETDAEEILDWIDSDIRYIQTAIEESKITEEIENG